MDGWSTAALAKKFGKTTEGIRYALNKLRIPVARRGGQRVMSPEEVLAAMKLVKEGVPLQVIADDFGVSRPTISRTAKRLGVKVNGRGRPQGS